MGNISGVIYGAGRIMSLTVAERPRLLGLYSTTRYSCPCVYTVIGVLLLSLRSVVVGQLLAV